MEFRLNLASRVFLDRRTVRRWLLLIGGFATLLLGVNLYYGYLNMQQLRQVDAHLVELDAKLMSQRSETAVAFTPENLARVKKQVETAKQIVAADQFRWTALLGRFEELLPDDVAIRSLRPNFNDRSLQISAVARDTEAMTALLDRLLASADLSQAYLLNQSKVMQGDGGEVVQFSVIIKGAF